MLHSSGSTIEPACHGGGAPAPAPCRWWSGSAMDASESGHLPQRQVARWWPRTSRKQMVLETHAVWSSHKTWFRKHQQKTNGFITKTQQTNLYKSEIHRKFTHVDWKIRWFPCDQLWPPRQAAVAVPSNLCRSRWLQAFRKGRTWNAWWQMAWIQVRGMGLCNASIETWMKFRYGGMIDANTHLQELENLCFLWPVLDWQQDQEAEIIAWK